MSNRLSSCTIVQPEFILNLCAIKVQMHLGVLYVYHGFICPSILSPKAELTFEGMKEVDLLYF